MDLGFDETQQMLKNSAREFLAQECQHTLVRAMEEDEKGYSPELWQQMVDLGWNGLAFPEEYGGTGGSFLDLAVLVEEMGRALVPGPFFSTVVLGGLTVLDAGSDAQKQELLANICEGQTIMTLALTEASATFQPWGVQVQAKRDGEDYVINGAKLFVPDAHVSDVMLVAARTSEGGGDSDGSSGITVFLVPGNSQGITATPLSTLASDKQCEVVFTDVRVPANDVLGEVGGGWPIVERALERAAAAKCVEMLGGAEAVLDMTVEYAKQRVQFGRPVGSFQAVQHHCADIATEVECSRYMAYQAAWRVSEGLPAATEVSMAKVWVSQAYRRVCAIAHQSHGAIGFTKEHNLQLYTRRARAQETAFGGAGSHKELVAQALGI
jgi:alkylation response protein AidB-like acyl-CoA dehydrogenase